MSKSVEPQPGATVTRSEVCSVASVRRVAAMLDMDPDGYAEGSPLPRGWQFILLGADTRRSLLRDDGFPGLGVPLPDLGLPCLLLGGRVVAYEAEIPIGASVARTSSIASVARKGTESNPLAVVTVRHELKLQRDGILALVESQTYVLLAKRSATAARGVELQWEDIVARRTVVTDDAMLFQYSALGFNSHRIHLDRAYAREIEGYPELVVNGGLTTLLLTELLRTEVGLAPRRLTTRHYAPLFCGRAMQLTAEWHAEKWRLRACDEEGLLCAEAEVETERNDSHGL